MAAHLDEEAQMVMLKTWWKENGRFVLIASALFVSVLIGGHFWKEYRLDALSDAASRYLTMMKSSDIAESQRSAQDLIDQHEGTVFATVARFKLAQAYVQKTQYKQAMQSLKEIIAKSENIQFRSLARIRLSRIMLTTGDTKEAFHLLAQCEDKTFQGWADWVRGDIYLKQDDVSKAAEFYRYASLALSDNPQAIALITQSLMSLPEGILPKHTDNNAGLKKGEKHA